MDWAQKEERRRLALTRAVRALAAVRLDLPEDAAEWEGFLDGRALLTEDLVKTGLSSELADEAVDMLLERGVDMLLDELAGDDSARGGAPSPPPRPAKKNRQKNKKEKTRLS